MVIFNRLRNLDFLYLFKDLQMTLIASCAHQVNRIHGSLVTLIPLLLSRYSD